MDHLERLAPTRLAAEWDNVGLLLGDQQGEVRQIMTCLTLTNQTAGEAIAAGAQLIVAHHPIMFRPVRQLTTGTAEGRMLLSLVRAGVAVYSPHTAFDNASRGINEMLAQRLGMVETRPIRQQAGVRQYKMVVFVPEKDLSCVADAMFATGAGQIGQYSQCSFRLLGTGTFFGSEAANPTVGQKGRREEVAEWRLEVICPEMRLEEVIRAMRRAHSYEEPAFDVYPLQPMPVGLGEARVGRLPAPAALEQLARQVKNVLKASAVQTVGDLNRRVETVAIVCGAGGDFLADALGAKVDVLFTGELRFHDYLAALDHGLSLVLPGHYATERFAVEELAKDLQSQFRDARVWAAQTERDPVNWVAE
jgi:dinuclear metal center YbgI/SA1388 family protein